MNMISTVPFYGQTDGTSKQAELVRKLTAAWEKKNSKTARAGGVSLMALSLAACGGSDDTPFSQADIDAATAVAARPAKSQRQDRLRRRRRRRVRHPPRARRFARAEPEG